MIKELSGYTFVSEINVSFDQESGGYILKLLLSRDEFLIDTVTALFYHISNLKVSDVGGGLSQFCSLAVDDISQQQLEKKRYEVWDIENESLSFYCDSISILKDEESLTNPNTPSD